MQYKICLFTMKLSEDHGIKLDCAELLSLSIFTIRRLNKMTEENNEKSVMLAFYLNSENCVI